MRGAGYVSALLAAALFGASFALGKPLLRSADPLALAGIFYAASGIGLGGLWWILNAAGRRSRREASIVRRDLGWLAAAILSGGVLAPVLALAGLSRTPAHVASLLSGTEALYTALLAVMFFGDALGRREAAGMVVILLGATAIVWPGASGEGSVGIGGIAYLMTAYLLWGLDNNFTQRLSGRDPLQISALKGLVAGAVNLTLAGITKASFPHSPGALLGAASVGFLCYGLSLTLFTFALRSLGAARTGALFASAPLFGFMLAWGVFGETPSFPTLAGGVAVLAGAWLLIRSDHAHRHVHEPMEHEHRHVHDEHHRHEHRGDEGPEPHSHPHRHDRLEHEHPHTPDLHHRHDHRI
jgi:drug/metabolite transporter (DMT)-like permease